MQLLSFIPKLLFLLSLGVFIYHMKMLREYMPCTLSKSELGTLSSFLYMGFLLFLSYRFKEKNMFKGADLYIILRNKLQNFSAGSV